MTDRYQLNETLSPIDPSSWRELNENWELIKSYLRFLERQIKFLAGGNEIDDIIMRIDTAIANAENATADVEQARIEFNAILADLNTLVTNAETATENANTAASNSNELNTALNSLKAELETLQTNLNNIVQTESERVLNEQNRVTAEQSRKNEETTRRENEAARVLKEQSRETAEQNRTTTFDTNMLTAEQKITMMQYLIDNLKSYDFNLSATYNFPNLIKWNGSTFIALKEVAGLTPVDDGVNYRLVAQRGVDGTGAVSSVNGNGPDVNGNVEVIMALVNNLVSDSTSAGLTAAQGKALKGLFDGLQQTLSSHVGATDNPHGVTAEQIALGEVQNFGVATQEEAETGTSTTKYMTPQRTKQAVDKNIENIYQSVIDLEKQVNTNSDKNKNASVYANALEESHFVPVNSLESVKRAIMSSKSFKLAFVGDSITAGADQVSQSDTYVSNIVRKLSNLTSNINLSHYNFSIPSTGISDITDSNFTGGINFNTPWTVAEKSWVDHIKDYEPDLLVIAFGMNGTGLSSEENYNKYAELYNITKTWNKAPDLVIVPTILPTKNTDLYNQSQEATLSIARSTRQFAVDNQIAIADANRLFILLRDGIDELVEISTGESNFFGFPNEWSGDVGSFSMSGNTLTPIANATTKFVTRNRPFYNGVIEIEVKFSATGIENALWINFRKNSELGRLTLLVIADNESRGYVELYSNDSTTGLVNKLNLDIKTTDFNKIKIESRNNRHIIYINGVEVINFLTAKKMHSGFIEIGAEGIVPLFKNLNIIYNDNL